MSYLRRDRKPKRKAAKRPLRAPSMEFDPIFCDNVELVIKDGHAPYKPDYSWVRLIDNGKKMTEHGECKAVWRNEAKDLTLWAKFVKWVRSWHG